MTLERCPGCAANFPAHAGATHPYIGASAACWALHSAVLAGIEPPEELLAGSTVEPVLARVSAAPGSGTLLLDAYAAQHHGVESPQAVQSVAVHLLVLHGVFAHGVAPDGALWIRRRAVRRRGVFSWLTPPPADAAYSLRHCFPGPGVDRPCSIGTYVTSVYEAWQARHQRQLDAWYGAFVVA